MAQTEHGSSWVLGEPAASSTCNNSAGVTGCWQEGKRAAQELGAAGLPPLLLGDGHQNQSPTKKLFAPGLLLALQQGTCRRGWSAQPWPCRRVQPGAGSSEASRLAF